MIAVVGGSGRLGTALVPLLRGAGHEVRVAGRTVAAAEEPGLEVVRADVGDPATLAAVVEGTAVVVSAVHGVAPGDRHASPARTDVAGNANLVDAALAAGADVVLVSMIGAGPVGGELQRAKWAAEEHLRASGARWTVVRAAAFREQWEEVLTASAQRGGRPVVPGRGRNLVNMVAVADVAAAVADACLDPSLRGRVLDVRGPQDLSLDDLAATLLPGTAPRHVPRAVLRVVGQAARPFRPDLARMARMALWMDTADLSAARGGVPA